MSLVSNNSEKVFLSLNTQIKVNQKVDIILSPEFYWLRIFELPVKNVTQAKNVLPTLFEDIIEDISDLSYHVIKLEEQKYLCFAYSNKKIIEDIKKIGISLSFVNSIYFSQIECKDFRKFEIDGKYFIYTEDDILVKVPSYIAGDCMNLSKNIDNINLSANKLDIKLYSNTISSKHIYSICFLMLVVIILNFYKIIEYKNEIFALDDKIEKLKINSSLPTSSIQTNSILKSYEKLINKEIKKREALEYLLKYNKYKLNQVKLDKDVLTLTFENADENILKEYISKKYKVISSKVLNFNLEVKVKI